MREKVKKIRRYPEKHLTDKFRRINFQHQLRGITVVFDDLRDGEVKLALTFSHVFNPSSINAFVYRHFNTSQNMQAL